MMRFVLSLVGCGLIAACGGAGSSTSAQAPTTPAPTAASDDPSCPVAVPGTSVTVEDADKGAALIFATTGDAVDVRRRAAEFARMHNESHGKMGPLPTGDEPAGASGHDHGAMAAGEHAGHGAPAGGAHAGHDMQGHAGHAGGMIGVHSRAVVEETAAGARLLFVALPADHGKLRDELAKHARHMASGSCSMGR